MHVTEEGLALIRRFEGFRAEAYRCPAGVWTIGYGHTSQAGPPRVRPGMIMSEAEARRVLAGDVRIFAEDVRAALTREVSPEQFSALVSFAFNVGSGAFRRSSVLRAVNAGAFADVPQRLALWVKADGRTLEGLVRRRKAEGEMFAMRRVAKPQARRWGLARLIMMLIGYFTGRRERN
jgi:lysozyme